MKHILILLALLSGSMTAQAQTAVKEWTFLVYMNADNNLYRFGLTNLKQMEKVGSTPDMNVVVEVDHEPRNLPTQRLLIQRGQPSQVLGTQPETDMGDWKHLAEFVAWGVQNYPARRYALVIWNHGAGWEGVSYDDNPRTFISIPDVAQALRQASGQLASRGFRGNGPLIDILNFDACLMSGLETAFEMKDVAKIMIGSQYNEPGAGEDYTAILSRIAKEPRIDPRVLAEHMVYEYVKQFPHDEEINYLAVDLTKIAAFTQIFRASAAQHVAAPGPLQKQLLNHYGGTIEGSDLIGGLMGARKMAPNESPLAASVDQVLNAYGYPAESSRDFVAGSQESGGGRALRISRPYPAVVRFRTSMNGQWKVAPLQQQSDGTYSVKLPPPMQYMVQRSNAGFTESRGNSEALATFVRTNRDPVIFHNQFPASSPIIAEAHNLSTLGATGMSLYYNASGRAVRDRGARMVPELRAVYMALQFAQVGAPEWTQFIGLR